ncbi:MAG TPA: glycosyltransferase [Pyrinomonadaceae bacterium]|nr:glycosyltransferase [Pyrinomonadaceae bacterium]
MVSQVSEPELVTTLRGGSPGRLRVLFFTSTLGGGGAEKHLLRIVNHLDREKFEVSLALAKPCGEFESGLSADVRKHHLNRSGAGSTTVRMFQAIKPLRQVIRRERPDLIFSVIDLANLVNVTAGRGMENRPKIVLGVQTPPSIAYGRSRHPVSRLMLRLIPRLYPKADQIVALSKGVAADLAALSPRMRERLTVIYNAGVEAEVLERARESVPANELPDGPLVVACGRLKALKGFSTLLDALAAVRKVVPAHLWIIGEGEQRPFLEKKIKRLGLQDCVRLLGFQQNPFKYMAAADLFVLSSLFEGFGNVIVEAMACGVPVVATDCPFGPREIIADGENGILVAPASAAALADGIVRVLRDDELTKRLARGGRARAHDFDARAITRAYEKLFLSVAGVRSAEAG